jgi:hypothetical protein
LFFHGAKVIQSRQSTKFIALFLSLNYFKEHHSKPFGMEIWCIGKMFVLLQPKDGQARGILYISGQRIARPTRGLYIVNGKKVVIK